MKRRRIITDERATWTPIGTLAKRLAGKLMAQREDKISARHLGGESAEPGNVSQTIADRETGEERLSGLGKLKFVTAGPAGRGSAGLMLACGSAH